MNSGISEKQIKKNIKNLKSVFEYILSTVSDNRNLVYTDIVFEKFKKIVEIKKFKNICIYDNLANKYLVYAIIKYARENKLKISILNDKLSSPKIINDVESYEKEKLESFKNSKTMGIKSVKLFILGAKVFDEKSYFLADKNLAKRIGKNNKALRVAFAHDFQIIPNIEILESSEIIDIIISENKVISIEKIDNT